jgi:hypothetical protein
VGPRYWLAQPFVKVIAAAAFGGAIALLVSMFWS